MDEKYTYSKDDIITMVVNTGEKTVDFYKNDQLAHRCKNIKEYTYKLAIFLGEIEENEPAISVTLQSFSISQFKS